MLQWFQTKVTSFHWWETPKKTQRLVCQKTFPWGKEVLLKSIAMALPVYVMSCFRLTKHHCQKTMSAMASFGGMNVVTKKKIYWISWDKLCVSKNDGGLGFRDIEDFNQALLAKQAWWLLNEPESLLAKVFKGRYYATSSFLICRKGYHPSYAWHIILLIWKGIYTKGTHQIYRSW